MIPIRTDLPRWAATLVNRYCRRLAGLVDFRLDPRLRGRVSVGEVVDEIERHLRREVLGERFTGRRALLVWLRTTSLRLLDDIHRQYLGPQYADSPQPALVRLDCLPPVSVRRLAAGFATGSATTTREAEADEDPPPLVALQDAFNRLLPADREILGMRHFECLTREEVATVFQLSVCRASHFYLSAVRRLRHELHKNRPAGLAEREKTMAQPASVGVR